MEVFRISKKQFSSTLAASGHEGRWNPDGHQVIYTSATRSLAALEMVVRRKKMNLTMKYMIMVISLADEDHLVKQVKMADMPGNWRSIEAYPVLRGIGSGWYRSQESLVLKVPSVLIPAEHNYIINYEHPDFSRHVSLIRTEACFWDSRLF